MLTDRQIKALKYPGPKQQVARNLYIWPRGKDSFAWIFRYSCPATFPEEIRKARGARPEMQIGVFPEMLRADAEEAALKWRKVLASGLDPITVRENERKAVTHSERRESATLETVARDYHKAHAHEWRNPKHAAQWLTSLENHIFPDLGARPLHTITSGELLDVLVPLNQESHETAKRVRQRLEAIYADAKLRKFVDANLPAELRHRLKTKRGDKDGFAAMPYGEVPGFVQQLRDSAAAPAVRLGLEWLILSASRSGEVRFMTWAELDVDGKTWTVPASRMKAGEEHRVPLTPRMLQILQAMRPITSGSGFVFPGAGGERPMSDNTLLEAVRRLGVQDATVHGFRKAFSTWANERTKFKPDVIEAALAHGEKDAVRGAYNLAEYWRQRELLAKAWHEFVTAAQAAKVVNIKMNPQPGRG